MALLEVACTVDGKVYAVEAGEEHVDRLYTKAGGPRYPQMVERVRVVRAGCGRVVRAGCERVRVVRVVQRDYLRFTQ
jgi:hypothetical protein